VPTQDGANCPGRDAELWTEPVLPTPLDATQLHHSLLHLERGLAWTSAWSRGPVNQASLTRVAVPVDPPMGALPRDTQFLGDVRDGPPLVDNPLHEQTTTTHIQTSISVGHEDLLVGEDVRHLH
jgi:hypothetical protein